MSMPLISIIMNCYNSDKYLNEAIDSVFNQTYKNFEIIFWDNRSVDQSATIAKSYGDQVKYFQSEVNVPLGEARNFAMAKAQGEFIAFLDCDDIWMPEKLEKQVNAFLDPEIGIVYSDALIFSDKKVIRRWFSDRTYVTGNGFSQLFQNYFLCMPTIVVRKSHLNRMEYWFDNRFSLIEEADFLCRLAIVSKMAMVDEVLAKWRIHPNSWTWKKYESFPDERELMLNTYVKDIPGFAQAYPREIEAFVRGIRFTRAKNFWIIGDGVRARKLLDNDFLNQKKSFALYALSFFPFKAINPILKLWGYGKLY